jgi:spore coat protein A, manganese oxidase
MFEDTMLVNGVVHPRVTVEPRGYRLRILNATQARFLNLQLYVASGPVGSQVPDLSQPGPDYLVLGTEGGFLARAVRVPSGRPLKITFDPDSGDRLVDPADAGGSLVTGPAERWDVVVDFSGSAGRSLILYSDAPAPFPGGDHVNDGPTALDSAGRSILLNQMIMRFDVAATATTTADRSFGITDGFSSRLTRPPGSIRRWLPAGAGSPRRPSRHPRMLGFAGSPSTSCSTSTAD